MSSKYNTVIFDLDGTLLNTLEDLADATNHALQSYNMPLRTIDEVRRFVGNGVRMLMIRAVPQGEDNHRFEEVFACFKEYYGKHCNDKTRAYDGIMEMLAQLKNRGYAVAIVSNKIDSAVKELQKRYFDELISVAIGEREGVSRKPAPDTVLTALQELGRSVDEAVYVGDSDVDIMILVDSTEDTIKQKGRMVSDITFDFNLDHDIMIMPIVKNVNHFQYWLPADPFYKNVKNEGVELYVA